MKEAKLSTALLDANHNLFVFEPILASIATAIFATDESLVHLHNAIQRLRIEFLHRRPDAMAEIPCRLVTNPQRSLELVGAHTLSGLTKQIDAQEPLPQGQVGIIEDRASGHRELIAAIVTVKLIALYDLRNLVGCATRAQNSVRPAESFEVFAALVFASKLLNKSAKINRGFHA